MGLLSLLDAMLDQPMTTALEALCLSPELNHALVGDESELRAVLELVIAYERADWGAVAAAARPLDVPAEDLPQLYLAAVEWAAELFRA